ncbi:MAG TPA: hypothetical protein VGJ32_05965 [Solirubrobacteraceae bacterium]
MIATASAVVGASGTNAAGAGVVLGSPSYVTGGSGFGETAPSLISNGGVPSGVVTHIRWRGWGKATATASGRASIYKPQGGYFPPVRVPLRATNIGHCPGQSARAYTTLFIRVPPWPGGPLGSWFKWSGSRNLCDYSDEDPRYKKHWPGDCGSIGPNYRPGDAFDISSYRVGCRRARRLARASRGKIPLGPSACTRQGCARAVGAFRCHWQRIHPDETAPVDTAEYPAERVDCTRGGATVTWWFVQRSG